MPLNIKLKSPQDLRKMMHLIYGHPGSGKSTLASQFPGAAFLATEKGLDHVASTRWEYPDGNYVIKTWEDLLAAARELVTAKVTTVVLDTVGNACVLAEDYVCRKAGEDFKSDGKLGYGKGSAMIANEIRRFFTGLSTSGVGMVLIAHSMQKTVSTRTGEVQKVVPFVPCDNKTSDLYNLILGMVDTALLLDTEADGGRIIRTKPGITFDAKDRSGLLPATIRLPKDNSSSDFAMLYEAFYKRPMKNAAPAVAAEEPANDQQPQDEKTA